MCRTWFAWATWACMLETVHGAVRLLRDCKKISYSAFECDYYYYYYFCCGALPDSEVRTVLSLLWFWRKTSQQSTLLWLLQVQLKAAQTTKLSDLRKLSLDRVNSCLTFLGKQIQWLDKPKDLITRPPCQLRSMCWSTTKALVGDSWTDNPSQAPCGSVNERTCCGLLT